ncbi:glycosyltransferase family 2 protein [Pseudomonadota bacterium]
MNAPLVSVIIAAHNSEKYLAQALDSVMAQTIGDWELIVVDDGSTDTTADIVATHPAGARYLWQANAGPSSARNLGLEAATGKYVVFLDSDDVLIPTKFAEQLECFAGEADLDIVFSGWQKVDSTLQPLVTVEPWTAAEVPDLAGCLWAHPFFLAAIMFRRSVLAESGGFDPELRQAEDNDLILRMMVRGARTMWMKKITVLYRQHPQSLTGNTAERVQSVDRVFTRFFSQGNLSVEVAGLENIIRFNVLSWIVWRLYCAGDHSSCIEYLRRSIRFFDGASQSLLQSWMARLMLLAREEDSLGARQDLRALLPLLKTAIGGAEKPASNVHRE